jgi:hypothetical protein
VFATYDTSKLITSPPYEQFYEPLQETQVFSRKVCLYTLAKQADATLTFDMCSSNKCEFVRGASRRVGRVGVGAQESSERPAPPPAPALAAEAALRLPPRSRTLIGLPSHAPPLCPQSP